MLHHSQEIVLITVALLPFSSPLCCYYWHTTERGGQYVTDQMKLSPYKMPRSFGICDQSQFCNKVTLEDDYHGNVTMWACDGGVCTEEGCSTILRTDGATVQVCCCMGDFCNPAATPTVLLSLAAAAAAMIATGV